MGHSSLVQLLGDCQARNRHLELNICEEPVLNRFPQSYHRFTHRFTLKKVRVPA